MSSRSPLGAPLIPAGGVAQSEIVHNEAIVRCEVLAAGIAHFVRTAPLGTEADGTVVLVIGVGTDEFADWDNKVAFKFGGSWRPIPDVDADGADIPIGELHAGLRFYLQDDGSSPPSPGFVLWDGAAWVDD